VREPLPADSPTAFGPDNTPFDALGGEAPVRALVDAFYDHMEQDADFAQTRALYPHETTESREKLHEFLCGWLGGPPLYVQRHGHPRLRGRHLPFAIGAAERDQWLACMGRAMDDCRITGDVRRFLEQRFSHVADFMRNQ
jgi:hemoglobin